MFRIHDGHPILVSIVPNSVAREDAYSRAGEPQSSPLGAIVVFGEEKLIPLLDRPSLELSFLFLCFTIFQLPCNLTASISTDPLSV